LQWHQEMLQQMLLQYRYVRRSHNRCFLCVRPGHEPFPSHRCHGDGLNQEFFEANTRFTRFLTAVNEASIGPLPEAVSVNTSPLKLTCTVAVGMVDLPHITCSEISSIGRFPFCFSRPAKYFQVLFCNVLFLVGKFKEAIINLFQFNSFKVYPSKCRLCFSAALPLRAVRTIDDSFTPHQQDQ
jgi:hypothetical protein